MATRCLNVVGSKGMQYGKVFKNTQYYNFVTQIFGCSKYIFV